jgi:multidrug resistance efflux pump
VRWYLILLLVASPVLFFLGKLAYSAWIVEVPAQVLFSMAEVRSRDAAQVKNIHVKIGQTVAKGQLLIELDNPEWRLRLGQLRAMSADTASQPYTQNRNLHEVLRSQVDRAEQRLALVHRLVQQGAATQGELTAAADERDRKLADLLALEQQAQQRSQTPADTRAQSSQVAEQAWLQQKLDALATRAPEDGVVSEISVQEGENVGPGTLLLRLRSASAATIYAYIDLNYSSYAKAGQPLRLRLPDGTWIDAHVQHDPDSAQTIPADIRAAFSGQKRGLLVSIATDQEIPTRWLVNQLPLEARFTHRWSFSWPWSN